MPCSVYIIIISFIFTVWRFTVNTSLLAMVVAILLALGLVIGLGVLSLTTGGLIFLFGRPRLAILKSKSDQDFAFSFKWDAAGEPAKFDHIKIRLFNPFGKPTQIIISEDFPSANEAFARDINFGPALEKILTTKGLDQCTVQVEVSSLKDGLSHQFDMNGVKFLNKIKSSVLTADEFNEKNSSKTAKPLFQTVKQSFIAEPLVATGNKKLKIATNPEFAGEFAGDTAGGEAATEENFSVSKVWIEDGCIVCDACETIFPEVFEVTDDSCIIKSDAPLNDGLKILEAADACPVEVIKYSKA